MPPFAPGRTVRVVATEQGTVVRVDPDRPVLRVLADAWIYVSVGVNLTPDDLDAAAASDHDEPIYTPGMPIAPETPTLVLKGHGANTLIVVGLGAQVFVTAGEIR